MEKDIPFSPEKGGRLRVAVRLLKQLPLDRLPSPDEWDDAVGELTQDEMSKLVALAKGHLERALNAESPEDGLEEAEAAILVNPRDLGWSRQVVTQCRGRGWHGDEAHGFFAAVERRIGKTGRPLAKRARWLAAGGVALAALVVGGIIAVGTFQAPVASPVQGPRDLTNAFDTQGVKANIQVNSSRLLLFPEATVAELSAWVSFPDSQIDLWEGTVSLTSTDGKVLTSRDVSFHGSNEGRLDPGQGIEIFEQFDAWPWFDQVSGFQITTTRILAKDARPDPKTEVPVIGTEGLPAGYQVRVWSSGESWVDRFASRVHTWNLEIENSGLKPFQRLDLALVWRDQTGQTLKTQILRPVSPYRAPLPSGAKLALNQETIFDSEIFEWPDGQEPHGVLELRDWQ